MSKSRKLQRLVDAADSATPSRVPNGVKPYVLRSAGKVNDAALDGLETVNESKPGAHADYGQAVLSVARGIRDSSQTYNRQYEDLVELAVGELGL